MVPTFDRFVVRAVAALCLGVAFPALSASQSTAADPYEGSRQLMIQNVEIDVAFHGRLIERAAVSSRVLQAISELPRHLFVPATAADRAYGNDPVAFAPGRRLPAPYVSALAVDLLGIGSGDRVLDLGTGSGYHAALLARLAGSVHSVESHEELARQASTRLARLGFDNVTVGHGRPLDGWSAAGPFDAILVNGSLAELPATLADQLTADGILLVPVESAVGDAVLTRITKGRKGKLKAQPLLPVDVDPLR